MIGKAIKKEVLKADKIANRRGLIEGVDSPYQWKKASKTYSKWEPMERIGTRKKI